MRKKKAFVLLFVFFSLFLAGCVEVAEEVWINPDNSGRIRIDIGIVRDELAGGENRSTEDIIAEFRSDMIKNMEMRKSRLEKLSSVGYVKLDKNYDEKLDHFIYDVGVKNVYKLGGIYNVIAENQIDGDLNWRIEVKRLENGNMLFRQVFENNGTKESVKAGKKDTEKSGDADKDLYYRITLYAPDIVTTNGSLNDKKDKVTWKVPFDLLSPGEPVHEFTAEIKKRVVFPTPIAAAVIILALVPLVLLIIRIKRKKR